MRMFLLASLLAAFPSARVAHAAGTLAGAQVTVCDSLVSLRRLMAQDLAQDPDAPPAEPDRTGCSTVGAETVGEVQRRTIIGGAPYECRSIADGPCRWVQP